MKSYTARSILVGLLISLMASLALFVVAAYVLLRLGGSGLRELQQVSRSRGMEAALAVSQMASERFDSDMAVKLSSVMNEIVTISRQRDERFQVQQMFMLRADGTLMAANEIARVASDSEVKFNQPEYTSALELPARSPVRVRELKSEPTAAAPIYAAARKISAPFGEWLSAAYPEKVVSEYHISVAVYPVDEELLAAGSVHLFARSTATNGFMQSLARYSVRTLVLVISFSFLLTAAILFLLLAAFRAPVVAAAPFSPNHDAPVLEEFSSYEPESTATPVTIGQGSAQAPSLSSGAGEGAGRQRILDAIPLDPMTRR